MGEELRAAVDDWTSQRGHTLPSDAVEKLETLCALWISYGRSMNLTSASSEAELIPHILDGLDCLACVRACGMAPDAPWIDVGSGGGFPGLVVAAASEHPIHLVEPRQKRAAFLELAKSAIKSQSTEVTRCRIGDSTWNEKVITETFERARRHYWVATARAVFEPAEWLVQGMNVVAGGGIVLVHLAHDRDPLPDLAVCAKMVGSRGVVVGHRTPTENDGDG